MRLRGLFTLLFSLCLAGAASALQVTLTPKFPIATVDFPSSWKITEIQRGVESKSPDEEVFLWFEVFPSRDQKRVMREHDRYFEGQGVKITGDARSSGSKENGVSIEAYDFPATWNGKATVLRYLIFDFGKGGQQLMMSYWASPEGDRKHDGAVQKIIGSLNFK